MAIRELQGLFEHELKDIYYAEHKLVDALSELAQESTNAELKQAFTKHKAETENHIKRLEEVFRLFGEPPEAETCQAIEGLIKEKKAFAKEKPTPQILDDFNVGAGIKTERYEISAYESLIQIGRKLKMTEAVTRLRENLDEEQMALKTLKGVMPTTLREAVAASATEPASNGSGRKEKAKA